MSAPFSRSKIRRLAFVLLLTAAAGAAFAVWQFHQQQQADALRETLSRRLATAQTVRVPRGSSLAAIAAFVVRGGAPVSAPEFIGAARRLGVDKSLQAGVYRFAKGDTVEKILQNMRAGKVAIEKITLIEGRTYADIRRQLLADSRFRHELAKMDDAALLAALSITLASAEGQFLPDTYFFDEGDSDLSILRRAHRRLKTTLAKHWKTRQDGDLFATPYDALILASIIEKETGKGEERPLIASVFTNRLRAGIRLQADPTVIYGIGENFDGNLTRADLRLPTPYNTYTRAGLTPTPIALPGEASISAALHPATSDYFYFVATGDGGHYFSKNLREHNNAVNRYQRKRKKK